MWQVFINGVLSGLQKMGQNIWALLFQHLVGNKNRLRAPQKLINENI